MITLDCHFCVCYVKTEFSYRHIDGISFFREGQPSFVDFLETGPLTYDIGWCFFFPLSSSNSCVRMPAHPIPLASVNRV